MEQRSLFGIKFIIEMILKMVIICSKRVDVRFNDAGNRRMCNVGQMAFFCNTFLYKRGFYWMRNIDKWQMIVVII